MAFRSVVSVEISGSFDPRSSALIRGKKGLVAALLLCGLRLLVVASRPAVRVEKQLMAQLGVEFLWVVEDRFSGRDFMKKLNWIFGFAVMIGLSNMAFGADYAAIKPPAGAKVAVVVFEDLECPTCARSYPIIWSVAKAHNVPVVLHDFPLVNIHPWTMRASLYARYFDSQSEKLGDDFRGYIYKNQSQIVPGNLDQFARKFADENKVALPFSIDPQGKLKEKVNADYELGLRLGVNGTPTIYIVGNSGSDQPLVDIIKDFPTLEQSYAQKIEDMQRKAAATPAATPAKNAANKPHKKKPS